MEINQDHVNTSVETKDSRTLAKEARAWVASPEGQKKIQEAFIEARKATAELNKPQTIELGNFKAPFSL